MNSGSRVSLILSTSLAKITKNHMSAGTDKCPSNKADISEQLDPCKQEISGDIFCKVFYKGYITGKESQKLKLVI